jgi:hypothetical protein
MRGLVAQRSERPAHNRLVVGSIPTEPTSEAKFPKNTSEPFKKSQVLPEATELLHFREILYILLGDKWRRQLEFRQKTNDGLFALYESEFIFHHRSARRIHEDKRILKHFNNYLGDFPPTI